MKEIRLTGLAFKNFIRGLEGLGYAPKWHYSDTGGDQYCDVVSSTGEPIAQSLEELLDTEVLTLNGLIMLNGQDASKSLQNTYRRWSNGTLPSLKKPSDCVVHPIDRLVAGLLILKAYAPDVTPDPCTRKGLSIMLQDERFDSISEQDRTRLAELGWLTNDALVWSF
jgi:hypothetical protein